MLARLKLYLNGACGSFLLKVTLFGFFFLFLRKCTQFFVHTGLINYSELNSKSDRNVERTVFE